MSPASPPDVPDGAVLLTGATGFVGMEVLSRYLERSDRHVVALVRAENDAHAAARLRATIDAACGDANAHAEKLFGFTAAVPLREGIARTVAWYRENR